MTELWSWGGRLQTANRKRAPLPSPASIIHISFGLRGSVCDLAQQDEEVEESVVIIL